MSTLKVTLPTILTASWTDRVDGVVCVNGSKLVVANHGQAKLTYPGGRTDLTPTEVATFVRNYLDEGFDAPFTVA